jgi:predicted SnoaL-like aldol condensation-catalyzing enzyme
MKTMNLGNSKIICLLMIIVSLFATILFLYNIVIVYGQDIKSNVSKNGIQTNTNLTDENMEEHSEKEMRNEKIIREFYNNVFIAKNASAAVHYLEENYLQHNPNVPTGRDAFINIFTKIFQNPAFNIDIKRIYVDGDYVIIHSFSSKRSFESTDNAVVDIYRIGNNGKIAEHWDVIQPIPSHSANNNTMFYLD